MSLLRAAPVGVAGLLVAATLLFAGPSPPALSAPSSASVAASATGGGGKLVPTPKRAKLRLVDSRFGKVIFEQRSGLVAYLFSRDKANRSKCRGACAKAWPPIKTKRKPIAGKGIRKKLLGVTRRRGGAKMVTYRKRPLYFYEHDTPGTIFCHDVREFGGDWFVVKRNGKPA